MMKCEVCGMVFPDNKVKHKPSSVMIHGCEEDDTYDVCPYCGSGDIYDIIDEIAKEISPYLSDMENVYYNLVDALLKQNKDQEQAERSAALGAVVAGLTWSRNTPTVSENTMKLQYACEMFRIRMSIKKMMQIGVLKAEICGKDENGWEMYKLLDCPYGIGGET